MISDHHKSIPGAIADMKAPSGAVGSVVPRRLWTSRTAPSCRYHP